MSDALRSVLEGLIGRERALDVRLPESRRVAVPAEPAEAAALVEVARCMGELQRAIENYQVATGCWSGRSGIAIGWAPGRRPDPT